MNRLLALALVLVLGWAGPAEADGIAVPNGDFELPKKHKHGEIVAAQGFVLEPKTRVTRFHGIAPHQNALALGRNATLHVDVVVPAPLQPKKLATEGWYGVASIDVLGLTSKGVATLEMTARVKDKRAKLASASVKVDRTARKRAKGKTVESRPPVQRLWLKIPSKRFHALAGKTLTITLSASGAKGVVVDDWRFDRFHDEPSRALVGKPNGKNGPDLLASGALGFLALSEHLRTAFSVLEVREKGPADKAGLRRSDLIVGVDGAPLPAGSLAASQAWFDRGHEAMLGRAIQRALAAGETTVRLTVLRDSGPKELALKLAISEGFGDEFPFDGGSTQALYDDLIEWIASHQKKNGAWPGNDIVNSSLAGLALIGTRDRRHKKAIKALADFFLKKNPTAEEVGGFSFWPIAFQGIFLCEYHLATGNKPALAWIEEAIEWLPSTTHECKWGMPAFGHSPKGLPYGNKALMAPCAHLLVFESLAMQCGVKSEIWKHIKPYVIHSWSDPKKGGHGGMGYNGSFKDKNEFWSRTGLTALALKLRDDNRRMQMALSGFMRERHPWMLNSHAYGEPGCALGLAGLALVDPKAFAEVMPQWRWRFLNAWQPGHGLRYSSPHMGAPYMGEEQIVNPAYGMLFAVRNRGLVMTGGKPERWLSGRGR